MIKKVAITMRGKQPVIYVDREKLPTDELRFVIEIDNKGRQAILFMSVMSNKSVATYRISPITAKRFSKSGKISLYTYWLIGLHRSFMEKNGLKKGDKVDVDYRKDRVVISSAGERYAPSETLRGMK